METAEIDTASGACPTRVRDQVRDALAVMAFSAGASAAMAATFVLLGQWAG